MWITPCSDSCWVLRRFAKLGAPTPDEKRAVEGRNFANQGRVSETERRVSRSWNNATHGFPSYATRFPKLCDWHIDVPSLWSGQSSVTSGTVIPPHADEFVEPDVRTVTPKQFLFHVIASRTRTVTPPVTRIWRVQEPSRELRTNSVTAWHCQGLAISARRFTNLTVPTFAIERSLSGYSKSARKRANLLLSSHNRSAFDLQAIWRCPRLSSITAATCRSVRELLKICCQSGNYRTRTETPFRRLRERRCGAFGSSTAANRTLLRRTLSPCRCPARGDAS